MGGGLRRPRTAAAIQAYLEQHNVMMAIDTAVNAAVNASAADPLLYIGEKLVADGQVAARRRFDFLEEDCFVDARGNEHSFDFTEPEAADPPTLCILSVAGTTSHSIMATDTGRKVNQDRGLALWPFGADNVTLLCGVFDGHGHNGEGASQYIIDELPYHLICTDHLDQGDPEAAFREALPALEKSMAQACDVRHAHACGDAGWRRPGSSRRARLRPLPRSLEAMPHPVHRHRLAARHSGSTACAALVRGRRIWVRSPGP